MRERVSIEGVDVSPDHFIDGRRVASAETFETRCPFDWDRKLADVSRGDAGTAALAVDAATRAFLLADDCNTSAIALYRKVGFVPSEDDVQIDLVYQP